MEERPISKKQEEILNYIKNEILERGFPPAVREICQAVGLKSTSSGFLSNSLILASTSSIASSNLSLSGVQK